MSLSFNRSPGPGETRACTDPWKFVIVRSNGNVCLCCRSAVVGNVGRDPIDAILEGEVAREMRRRLLVGDLPDDCLRCSERGTTSLEGLHAEVEELLYGDDDELEDLRLENMKLKEVRSDLLRERDALRGHVANLEAERPHLLGHIANLERERGQRAAAPTEPGRGQGERPRGLARRLLGRVRGGPPGQR